MTISGYSNAIVDVMLGWLKGLANWVLRLFNLAGNAGASPLLWLSHNWLKLLVFFLVLGVVLDRLVWLIRWRPYWVWFRKERVIVNDNRFFSDADLAKNTGARGELKGNWDERDYVVASTVVRRREAGEKAADARDGRAPSRSPSGDSRDRKRTVAPARRPSDRQKTPEQARAASRRRSLEQAAKAPDSIFSMELKKAEASDVYEDEVFNVSNLPVFDEFEQSDGKTERRRVRDRRQ